MSIGFLGAGNMARAIGGALATAGHEVVFGSRDESKAKAIAMEIGLGTAGAQTAQVAERGDVLVSSVRNVPSTFLPDLTVLDGKILIDLNNRDYPRDHSQEVVSESLAEAAQRDVPRARVVKALNNQAMEVFNAPAEELREAGLQGFMAGDDDGAKAVVSALLKDIGLQAVDFGPLSNAWLLEVQADILRCYMFSTGDALVMPGLTRAPEGSPRFGERRPGTY